MRAESAAHRELKRMALEWAREHRLLLGGMEVRLPRSNYRADAAAATPRILSENAVTAVFECKVSRADFLRDGAVEAEMTKTVARLSRRLIALREMIAAHRPDLRRGEELFPEFDTYDLRGLRHETHDRLVAQLHVAQHKLHDGTKFSRLLRWRAASFLYLVVPAGLIAPTEVPEGWGLLERKDDALTLSLRPCLNITTPAERVALLERIALAGNRRPLVN